MPTPMSSGDRSSGRPYCGTAPTADGATNDCAGRRASRSTLCKSVSQGHGGAQTK